MRLEQPSKLRRGSLRTRPGPAAAGACDRPGLQLVSLAPCQLFGFLSNIINASSQSHFPASMESLYASYVPRDEELRHPAARHSTPPPPVESPSLRKGRADCGSAVTVIYDVTVLLPFILSFNIARFGPLLGRRDYSHPGPVHNAGQR
jgi:hypothetical protein